MFSELIYNKRIEWIISRRKMFTIISRRMMAYILCNLTVIITSHTWITHLSINRTQSGRISYQYISNFIPSFPFHSKSVSSKSISVLIPSIQWSKLENSDYTSWLLFSLRGNFYSIFNNPMLIGAPIPFRNS